MEHAQVDICVTCKQLKCESPVQILECESNPAGSVLAHLDHCVTPGGKRVLRGWLAAPLHSTADIHCRQDAVAELLDSAASGMEAARDGLRAAGDIERGIVHLAAAAAGAIGRDAPGVVLYENPSRRKVRAVTAVLRGLEAVQQAVEELGAVNPKASILVELVTWDRRMPDFRKSLEVRICKPASCLAELAAFPCLPSQQVAQTSNLPPDKSCHAW